MVSVFAPIEGVLGTVLAMLFIDLITGVLAARKRGEKITSRGLRRSVSKFFIYEVAIAAAFLCETYLIGASLPVLKMVSSLIGIVELKSVLENLDTIQGESFFRSIVNKLNSQGAKPTNESQEENN